ncbi:MAG: ubiquinone biosynthesis protein [Halanaerobiales bacterium]|nr:ubiquinone biosynthesis protein [Halanaerobiales bacterium]
MVFNLSKQYRHLQRYRQIAEILLKNGLGFLVDWLDLAKFLPFKKRFGKDDGDLNKKNLARRIRHVLQELGPTYIKLGQILSTRADILPPQYIKELRLLQDKAPSVPFSEIRKILIAEVGEDFADIFREIDPEPQAAASIAQTYHAVLDDGTDVILKIQRPGIEEKIRIDLEILHNLVLLAEDRGLFPGFIKPSRIINEFRESLKKELNFQREIANIKKFRDNFKNDEHIIVPRVYEDLSTSRLIVMEEIKGIKLNELEEAGVTGVDRSFLASLGARSLMKQVLIDGFFHADPHPGNIFIVDSDKLAYIDFGMMGQLTQDDRDKLSILFIAILKRDVDIIVDLLLEIGLTDENINLRKFKLGIQDLLNRYYGVNLADIKFMAVIDDIQHLLYNFHIRMPEEFFLLFRAIGVSEGVGFMLDPDFNIVDVGNDFIRGLLLDKLKPENLVERAIDGLWALRKSTRGLPEKFARLFSKLVDDDFTIKFKHVNLEGLINKIDIVSNRLAISMIISALVIGSSMILQTDMKPLVFGIPVLGFLGYIIAGVMGLWLVIAIFRSGRF